MRHAEQVDAFADRVAERFGEIDLWINNAGVLEPVKFVPGSSSTSPQEPL